MRPPKHICKALYEKNPQLRLAWRGNGNPGDLSDTDGSGVPRGGCFSLIRLIPSRAAGHRHDPETLREFWDCTMVSDVMGSYSTVRDDKGTLFNRTGGTSLDWDPLERVAIIALDFNSSYNFSSWDVFSGKAVKAISIIPLREAKREEANVLLKKGRDMDAMIHDYSREASNQIFWQANKENGGTAIGEYSLKEEAFTEWKGWMNRKENYFLRKARKEQDL